MYHFYLSFASLSFLKLKLKNFRKILYIIRTFVFIINTFQCWQNFQIYEWMSIYFLNFSSSLKDFVISLFTAVGEPFGLQFKGYVQFQVIVKWLEKKKEFNFERILHEITLFLQWHFKDSKSNAHWAILQIKRNSILYEAENNMARVYSKWIKDGFNFAT